jgi:hypothetical protein
MLSPQLVGQLNGAGLWRHGRRVHALVGPAACAAVHEIVTRAPTLVSSNLRLKHHYDYVAVQVDPRAIQSVILVGDWRKSGSAAAPSRVARMRAWHEQSGGWKSVRRHLSANLGGRFVLPGDWDLRKRPFQTRGSIVDLFMRGLEPAQTEEYQKMRRRVESGDFRWTRGCTTVGDVDRYFDDLRAAFESIRRDGYRTQEELGRPGGDEIRVCVDRAGELCAFGGGTHRLMMAHVLDLDRLPVLVKRVHADWVAARLATDGSTVEEAIRAGLQQLEP